MAAESLKEGETCSIVLPSTKNDPKVIELDTVLKDWVNETLASERIIVKDLRDDLYDGNGYLKKIVLKAEIRELDKIENNP